MLWKTVKLKVKVKVKVNVKLKLSLCFLLIEHHAMKAHWGVEVQERIEKFPDLVYNEIMTTINTRWEAIQRAMAAKLTRLTHKIARQLHLVAGSCTICSSRSRRPVRKLLDTPSYSSTHSLTSALDGSEWPTSRPGRFTPRERTAWTHWIGG
jgi:hypothetical protein